MPSSYEIRLCENPKCGLRYPLVTGHPFGDRCPSCAGKTIIVLKKEFTFESSFVSNPSPFHIEVLLDNIRSGWNVGSIFRTADGFGIQKIYLCGITPDGNHSSVQKTALGAEKTIPWVHSRNALETAINLKSEGAHLWALEQDRRAIPINTIEMIDDKPIVLILGNEVSGVDPELLDLSERILFIPMKGKKHSFNVEVAFGITVSILIDRIDK